MGEELSSAWWRVCYASWLREVETWLLECTHQQVSCGRRCGNLALRDDVTENRKILIHLTDRFPFGLGENFLAAEIKYLSDEFDEIYLIPLHLRQSDLGTRHKLPDNVDVYTGLSGNAHLSTMAKSVRLAPRALSLLLREFLRVRFRLKQDIRHAIVDALFAVQTNEATRSVTNWLSEPRRARSLANAEIFVYSTWFHLNAAVAVELKKLFEGRPNFAFAVSRAHGYDLYPERSRFGYLPKREHLLAGLDRVFPVSQNGVELLRGRFPQYAAKVHWARLGAPHRGRLVDPLTERLVVVTTSWITPVKRLELAVAGLSHLADMGVKFHWFHLGKVKDDGLDDDYGSEIMSLAARDLPAGSFTFLGFRSNDKVAATYRELGASLLLNVSRSEGVPVSLMEARSVEDPRVQFCVFCYNVQPGVVIDYATGKNRAAEDSEEP